MSGSRDKLLRAAEILFSSKGYGEVSLREIASHAQSNTGLVSYYFHGKQALFDEVLRMHARALSRERMKRLQALAKSHRKPSVEDILKAWLLPWLQPGGTGSDTASHLSLIARLPSESWRGNKNIFGSSPAVMRAFTHALHSCLPYLSTESIRCRLQFVMSAMVYGLHQPAPLAAISRGLCDPEDLEAAIHQILPFACAGFCAPETTSLAQCRPMRGRSKT